MDEFLTWIKKRRSQLQQELEELDAAERIYLKSGVKPSSKPPLPFGPSSSTMQWRDDAKKSTIKEAVLKVLESAPPHGLTANEILERLQRFHDPTLVRTSLSPQLSRLKEERKIVSRRPYWLLARQEPE